VVVRLEGGGMIWGSEGGLCSCGLLTDKKEKCTPHLPFPTTGKQLIGVDGSYIVDPTWLSKSMPLL